MTTGHMDSVWATSRGANWWHSKIPPLLAVGYAVTLVHGLGAATALAALGALLFSICCVAAYGHVINDIFDVEEDRRRGKPNAMARLSGGRRLAVALMCSILAFVPQVWVGYGVVGNVLLGVNLLLPTVYSGPPLHLKERGVWGVLADASGVHVVPALFFAASLTHLAVGPGSGHRLVILAVGVWTLAAGVRGILLHQFADRESDSAAGVNTFGGCVDPDRLRVFVRCVLYPFEVAALVAFTWLLLPHAPFLALALPAYLLLEAVRLVANWHLPLFYPAEPERELYLPLASNEFYEVWFPLTLAVQLAVVSTSFVVLPILQVALFYPNVASRVRAMRHLWRDVRDPRCRRKAWYRFEATAIYRRFLANETRLRHHSPDRSLLFDRIPLERRRTQVIVGATYWTLNGVNVFSANLVRGLRARGVDAKILLSEEHTSLVTPTEREMPKPDDIPFVQLPVTRRAGWGTHWGVMTRYLEENAPCVYVPNSDWRHSCVSPRLSDAVRLVGVVHSDDPLHYDHVARLGRYWNGIATTSKAIAEKVLAADPTLAGRLTTIPIGVNIPREMPERTFTASGPLRLIYHGVLKQYQKRILDLPRIVEAVAERGIPAQLTIAGGGPEENELREASEELVEQGLIEFLGVVPHDQIHGILEQHDVYILTSEFEGMPNALLEAMGRGCVPLVTKMTSGIPELVKDGHNGFLVPIGDIAAFVDRIGRLQSDRDLRRGMAVEAHGTVTGGAYRVDDMVEDYIELFERSLRNSKRGIYQRPRGPLSPPPNELDGVSVFPVALTHKEPGVGRFPSRSEAKYFNEQLELLAEAQAPAVTRLVRRFRRWRRARQLQQVNIIIGSPAWTATGINRHAEHLARGLRRYGLPVRVLLTEQNTDLVDVWEPPMARPADIPIDELAVSRSGNWGEHWGALISYLEEHAPCIYIPNHDWRHSGISSRLSDAVRIVGVLHGDDPLHYDHVVRLGKYWNAIVAGSPEIERKAEALCPEIAGRLSHISYGMDVSERMIERHFAHGTLSVVCVCSIPTNELVESLAAIAAALEARRVPANVVLVSRDLRYAPPEMPAGVRFVRNDSHEALMAQFERSDACLTTEHVDGIAEMVTEAMGRGCVPISATADGQSPVPIRDGVNGFIVPTVDLPAIVDRLERLHADVDLRRKMAVAAHATVATTAYRIDDMVQEYMSVFRRVIDESARRLFRRPTSKLEPPPRASGGMEIFAVDLSYSVYGVGRFPSEQDYRDYREALPKRLRRKHPKAESKNSSSMTVVVGSPNWTPSGVNAFNAALVRGLRQEGVDARVLLTEDRTDLVRVGTPRMDRPDDVPIDELPVARGAGWGAHWGAMIRYLECLAPCIYIPNDDWRHSCVTPMLSNAVQVVGVLHEDHPLHLEHAQRLGEYWNAVVAGSRQVADQVKATLPRLAERLVTIFYGAELPERLTEPDRVAGAPLELIVVLAGSGVRIDGVERVLGLLATMDIRVGLTVVCDDPRQTDLGRLSPDLPGPCSITVVGTESSEELREAFESGDAVWLRPEQGVAYHLLMQAMGHGCVPVVSRKNGALSTPVHDGHNGFYVPDGDVERLAAKLALLHGDPARRHEMAAAAHRTARASAFTVKDMVRAYLDVFERVQHEARNGTFRRPKGTLLHPPPSVERFDVFPVQLNHEEEGVGAFVDEGEFRDFQEQLPPFRNRRRRSRRAAQV